MWKTFLTEVSGGLLIVLAMTLLASLMSSCKTVEQSEVVTEVKHDTVRIYTQKRDSVVYRDSVFVHVYTQGDTVYYVTEKWNVRYNDRVRVDTVYVSKEAQKQEKKTEVVEKKQPWYDDFLTKILLCLSGGGVLLCVAKLIDTKVLRS